MKHSEILQEIKTQLPERIKNQWVCLYLDDYEWLGESNARDIQKYIDTGMGDMQGCSVVDWLHEKHKIPKRLLTYENMLQYRLAWLDQMISHYQKQGK